MLLQSVSASDEIVFSVANFTKEFFFHLLALAMMMTVRFAAPYA
jgi:hypothetical protein